MSAHGFRSVFMVGAIAATALGCYLVSLRVASERAELEGVENRIVLAQRDIRLLETEIGTRGRLAQLERWNVKVIRLSAPAADQFVEGAFQLATLVRPERRDAIDAPVVLASAPLAPRPAPVGGDSAAPQRASRPLGEMMHVAGYSKHEIAAPTARPRAAPATTAPSPGKLAIATKPPKVTTGDPLAPLSTGASTAKTKTTTTKDPGSN